ncbi:hypothetical protein TWF281_001433 [Arthrobotrys megalospora]
MSKNLVHEIDEQGNVLITCYSSGDLVEQDLGVLRVSSRAVSRASPILEDLIYHSYFPKTKQEPQIKQEPGTELPDDCRRDTEIRLMTKTLESAIVAMNIIHHNIDKLPKAMSLLQLYNLCSLCDRYKLKVVTTFAVEKWITPLWNTAFAFEGGVQTSEVYRMLRNQRTHPLHTDLPRWLWVGYVSQHQDIRKVCTYGAVIAIKSTEESAYTVNNIALHPGMTSQIKGVLALKL